MGLDPAAPPGEHEDSGDDDEVPEPPEPEPHMPDPDPPPPSGSSAAPDLDGVMARKMMSHFVPTNAATFPRDVFDVSTEPRRLLGRVHKIWGKVMRFTCSVHPQCALMLETKWLGEQAGLCAGYSWLHLGKVASNRDHADASKQAADAARAVFKSQPCSSGGH